MRLVHGLTFAAAIALVMPTLAAQGAAQDPNASRAVAGGGITVAGWTGKMDESRENTGLNINSAKFAAEAGGGFHVTTGPSMTYWNPANKAAGNYTVEATFAEKEYMGLNDHPHPYGIAIAGNDLGTPTMSILYCSAYGDGRFIVRGFGPAAFPVNPKAEANAAINKAAGKGSPVMQKIAMSVTATKVECAVNGTVVGSYDKAAVIGAGKLKSTDGVYGLRFGHNTEVVVTGFSKK
jgi:uncharacterized protein YfiM (DUF2279 family)